MDFKRLSSNGVPCVEIQIDGHRVRVPQDETVASAILLQRAGSEGGNKQDKLHDARSCCCDSASQSDASPSTAAFVPYCMMGVCFGCLAEIDGEPNRQGCMTQVRDGMVVRRRRHQQGRERK